MWNFLAYKKVKYINETKMKNDICNESGFLKVLHSLLCIVCCRKASHSGVIWKIADSDCIGER